MFSKNWFVSDFVFELNVLVFNYVQKNPIWDFLQEITLSDKSIQITIQKQNVQFTF